MKKFIKKTIFLAVLTALFTSQVHAVAGTLNIAGTTATTSGNIYSPQYSDTANSAYFMAPASASQSLITAGKASFGTTNATDTINIGGNIGFSNGPIIKDVSGKLQLQAGGTGIGDGGTGSIYFLDSSGNTKGRIDTALSNFGTGADGAITVSANKNINTDTIAAGRTVADGVNYYVSSLGANTISNATTGTGPVSWWKMDEASNGTCTGGADVCDAGSGGNHGTVTGTSITTGLYGNARSLSGGTTATINTGTTGMGTTNSTWEAWVKINTNQDGNGIYTSSGNVADHSFRMFTNASGNIRAGIGWVADYTYSTTLQTGTWYHIAVTKSGSSWIMYLNGASVKTWTDANSFVLGTAHIGQMNGGVTWSSLNGLIDDVRVYNYARSADQVAEDMANSTASITGIAANDEVLLINLQGSSTNNGNVGKYETLTVQSVSGNTITTTTNISKIYGATTDNTTLTGQRIMVQRIPQYTDVTVNASTTLTANAWNGAFGGVLMFRANGTVTNNGTIKTDGLGYQPGITYYGTTTAGYQGETYSGTGTNGTRNANNGGGGPDWQTGQSTVSGGGGGGAYGTAGTNATADANTTWGYGATTTYGSATLATLFLGSAGGAGGSGYNGSTWGQGDGVTNGKAGAGGGVLYIAASTLTNNGTISSNGINGNNGWGFTTSCGQSICGGGGGGGAGGSLYIDAGTSTLGTMTAFGGTGGSGQSGSYGGSYATVTYGGTGGSGRIYINYQNTPSGSTTPTATVNASNEYSTLFLGATNTSSSDVAEQYVSQEELGAGEVVVLDPSAPISIKRATRAYDGMLVGIVSTNPGVILGQKDGEAKEKTYPVALSGRVPVRIDPASEPIHVGDYLTSSTTPGRATRATHSGFVVARALEDWQPNTTVKPLQAFVQPSYYAGDINQQGQLASLAVNNLTVSGQIAGSEQIRDAININPGETRVAVTKTWEKIPISITITPSYTTTVYITDIANTGFVIHVGTPPTKQENMRWQAWW